MKRKNIFGNLRRKGLLLIALSLVIAVTASACATGVSEERVAGIENQIGKVSEPTTERHFYITVAEIKGYTSGIEAPSVNPKDLSDGYGFYPAGTVDPERPDRWGVGAYFFMPASMIAFQGDKVSLTTIVLNGDEHTIWIEGPDGNEASGEELWNRGREYKTSFIASKAGTYILHCDNHEPTMTAYIQVLPRT